MRVIQRQGNKVTFGDPEAAKFREREQKIRDALNKAKKPNLTDKEKLGIIFEQNQLILEMLSEKPPTTGG